MNDSYINRMKHAYRKLGIAFMVFALVSSVFNILNMGTGNENVRYFVIAQLAVSIFCAVLFLAKKEVFFSAFVGIFATLNMLPLFLWLTAEFEYYVILFGKSFNVFPAKFLMFLFHLTILIIGICTILSTRRMIKVQKDSSNSSYSSETVS